MYGRKRLNCKQSFYHFKAQLFSLVFQLSPYPTKLLIPAFVPLKESDGMMNGTNLPSDGEGKRFNALTAAASSFMN